MIMEGGMQETALWGRCFLLICLKRGKKMSKLLRSKFLGATTVGERGQIVIPAAARKALGIENGDKLLVFGRRHREGLLLIKAEVVNKLVSDAWSEANQLEKLLVAAQTAEEEGQKDE